MNKKVVNNIDLFLLLLNFVIIKIIKIFIIFIKIFIIQNYYYLFVKFVNNYLLLLFINRIFNCKN